MLPEIKFVLSTLPVFLILLAGLTHTDSLMEWVTMNRFMALGLMLSGFLLGRLVRDLK